VVAEPSVSQTPVYETRNGPYKEVNRQVGYGENEEGTLLVWLEDQEAPRQRRTRRRNADPENLAAQVQ
jgi:hypothetical protein